MHSSARSSRGGELTADEVRRIRAAAQLLHRPSPMSVADLVRRLLAMQAQDTRAAALAFRARTSGLTPNDVAAARADREIVRAWGPRGTLHYIAVEDLPWLLPLVGPPRVTGTLRRLRQEGIEADPADLVARVMGVLAGQAPMTKAELGERLGTRGQAIVHLAALAAFEGRVLLGPDRAGKPTYVSTVDWLGGMPSFESDRDRALAELARRYLRAHAPAQPADLAMWSGLPLRDVQAGWRAIGDELTEMADDWRFRNASLELPKPFVRLAPAFDEILLGWRSRELIVAEPYASKVHPGGGMLSPTVIVDGRVAGTWRWDGRRVDVSAFETIDNAALDEDIADLTAYTVAGISR